LTADEDDAEQCQHLQLVELPDHPLTCSACDVPTLVIFLAGSLLLVQHVNRDLANFHSPPHSMPVFRLQRFLRSIPSVNLDVVAASQPLNRRIATLIDDLSAVTGDAASGTALNTDTSRLADRNEVDEAEQILSSHGVTVEELSDASDVAI
jgi:hypothetical protein